MRRMNFYSKLFLVVLITVIVSSGLILGITLTRDVNNLKKITEQNLTSSANQKAKIFDSNINSLHSLSKSIADDVEILDYFKKLNAGLEDQGFYGKLKLDLEEEFKSYPGLLENAFFVFKGYCIVDGLGGTSVGYNFDEVSAEWYTNVLTNKIHYMGKPKQSPITGLPVMISAYPILDESNNILAIFGLPINLNGFSDLIINNSEDTKESTMIVDLNGTVVAANQTELIYQYIIATELPELNSYLQQQKQGIIYYEKDGIDYIAAVQNAERGVAIIQSLPVSAYRDPIVISTLISIVILVLIIGFVAYITYKIAKNITRPIDILVDELVDMTLGIYNQDVPKGLINRQDEFGKLGNALETMKKQTTLLINNLNLSNEEIEASLEEVLAGENELMKQNKLLIESEDKLKMSHEYNMAIIKVLPDMIFVLDKEGTFLDVQVSQENELLIPKELIIGKNLREVMPEAITEMGVNKIQAALATGQLQNFKYELEIDKKKEIYELRIVQFTSNEVVAISRNITKQHLYQQQIEYLSYHDQLTGLCNRRFFEEELKRIDIESNLPICIIMADVNGLKLINDSFGHQTGDALLARFAEVLKKACRSDEIISRTGGDEFVILLPQMQIEYVEELIHRIKSYCYEETVAAINLSVSFGWEVKRTSEEDINVVLKCAEDFMYKTKLFESPSMRGNTIGAIINALHEKNGREEEHSHRVSELCEKLAIASQLSIHEVEVIKSAGLLHDIGKIAIHEDLLNKPGKLTKEEFEEVARHPEIGYRILCSVNEMADIAEFALSHHERWDGKGYPRGLKGEEIPIQSRMIAIADSFDAMTSNRSYRSPISTEEAAIEIIKNAGTQFDSILAHRFVNEVLAGYKG